MSLRVRGFGLALAAALGLPAALLASPPPASANLHTVVVTGPAAAAAVSAASGRVLDRLPLIGGVVARVPAGAVLPGVVVTSQRPLAVAGQRYDPEPVGAPVRGTVGVLPGADGAGVTVALVDTGVAEVADLAGRVRHVDLTGTGGGDPYGHGTFLAGLLAGDGSSSGGRYLGLAPRARLIDVKVARPDGSTDLVTVLRGLQWIADQGRVDVVNLSLSSASPLPWQLDPLTRALDALWRRGVVVVVPSGNDGPRPGSVTSPGLDPTLLTTGALDGRGTLRRADDRVAAWSGRGPSWQGVAKPDLVAPGAHLIGLRAPGSLIDAANPQARVGTAYFRGSGTSMSAAVVSGAVADLLSVRPGLRPEAVKALLTGTAYDVPGPPLAAGAGGLDLGTAIASAGSVEPTDHLGPAGEPVPATDATQWRALAEALGAGDRAAAEAAWRELSAESRAWASREWASLDPASRAWASRAWASRAWASRAWASRAWAAARWSAARWSATAWSSRAWAGLDPASRAWASRAWASRAWAAVGWAAPAARAGG